MLVTSREPLDVYGEAVLDVGGLAYPGAGKIPDLKHAGNYSAVKLFTGCARRAWSSFRLDENSLPHVLRICRLVDGLPLGIELAASWVRSLTCARIADEIEDGLGLLSQCCKGIEERHQSVERLLDQAWDQLSDEERRVSTALAVFRGGIPSDAAWRVADATPQVLSALTHRSVLRLLPSGRYDMHPLVHRFARNRLDLDSTAAGTARYLHCRLFCQWLATLEPRMLSPDQPQAVAQIEVEIENVRQAWIWGSANGCIEDIESASHALFRFYDSLGWFPEAIRVFSEALEALRSKLPQLDDRSKSSSRWILAVGRLLTGMGYFQFLCGHYERGIELWQESISLLERKDNLPAECLLLETYFYLGSAYRRLVALEPAEEALTRCLDSACHEELPCFLGLALGELGLVMLEKERLEEALRLARRGLKLLRNQSNPEHLSHALLAVGRIAHACGETEMSRRWLLEAIKLTSRSRQGFFRGIVARELGVVCLVQGLFQEARVFLQRGIALLESVGNQGTRATALRVLGDVLSMEGALEQAQSAYLAALKLASRTVSVPVLLDVLTGWTAWLIMQNETGLAWEVLEHVLYHPKASYETRCYTRQLYTRMKSQMGIDEAIQFACNLGK